MVTFWDGALFILLDFLWLNLILALEDYRPARRETGAVDAEIVRLEEQAAKDGGYCQILSIRKMNARGRWCHASCEGTNRSGHVVLKGRWWGNDWTKSTQNNAWSYSTTRSQVYLACR